MRIIGVIIIIGMVFGAVSTIDNKKFIDLPSFLLVVGGSLGYVLAKGKSSNFIKNFGDGSVYNQYTLSDTLLVSQFLQNDPAKINILLHMLKCF